VVVSPHATKSNGSAPDRTDGIRVLTNEDGIGMIHADSHADEARFTPVPTPPSPKIPLLFNDERKIPYFCYIHPIRCHPHGKVDGFSFLSFMMMMMMMRVLDEEVLIRLWQSIGLQ